MKMNDRLNAILAGGSGVEVLFSWDLEKVNKAMKKVDDHSRLELTMDLFCLWLERSPEAKDVFWNVLRYERGEEVFYSLTADGRQLRVWFERPDPARARPEHVDSMGRGLLFEVLGNPEAVWKYVEGLLEIRPLQVNRLENGVILFEPEV